MCICISQDTCVAIYMIYVSKFHNVGNSWRIFKYAWTLMCQVSDSRSVQFLAERWPHIFKSKTHHQQQGHHNVRNKLNERNQFVECWFTRTKKNGEIMHENIDDVLVTIVMRYLHITTQASKSSYLIVSTHTISLHTYHHEINTKCQLAAEVGQAIDSSEDHSRRVLTCACLRVHKSDNLQTST